MELRPLTKNGDILFWCPERAEQIERDHAARVIKEYLEDKDFIDRVISEIKPMRQQKINSL